MEPVLELPIRLPGKGSRRLLRNLHQQLRAAILDGRLQPGTQVMLLAIETSKWKYAGSVVGWTAAGLPQPADTVGLDVVGARP